MAVSNGIDLGSIYGLLIEIGKTVSGHDAILRVLQDDMKLVKATMATKTDLLEVRAELKRDIAGNKLDITDLRQTLTAYHASVIGHGIMMSELEDRVRRIERHLELPPAVHG